MTKTSTNSKYKYQNLKNYLMEQIRSGGHGNGGRLEPELELCSKFNLSRNTTRQALQELENEGYIYRIHGSGTFVRNTAPMTTRKVALLIYDSAYMAHPVTGTMIRGISEVLESRGYVLDVLASKRSFHDENISRLAENYAGFLIGTYQLDDLTLRELSGLDKPCLFVKNYLPGKSGKAVRVDFRRAGFLAAEHLAQTGCRNLALLYSGDEIAISGDFRNGVVDAALEYGVRLRRENIKTAGFGDRSAVPGIAAELLAHTDRVDGIICSSDELGAAMVMELKKSGLRIPLDIAVTGCNNMEYAELCDPPLTTVDIHIAETGRRAAQQLLNGIDGQAVENELLVPELIIRASTKGKPNENRNPL